jgi:hypothetical protein
MPGLLQNCFSINIDFVIFNFTYRSMNRVLAFFLLCTLASVTLHAQTWELKTDKGGIRVYTAKVENTNFKSVKVTCDIAAKPAQLLAVLLDVNKHEEWVYNTKVSRVIKKTGDNDIIFYAEVRTPWPFTNRDYVAHLVTSQPSAGTIIIDSHAEPALLPENKNLVRIIHSDSRWVITSVNSNLQHIEYIVRFDPAGSIPAWLMNMFVTEGPYETFKKLQDRVHLPAYENAHFDFIKG